MIGEKFSKLTVIEKIGPNKSGHIVWLCECECGKTAEVSGTHLRTGHKTSCGCAKKKTQFKRGRKSTNRKPDGESLKTNIFGLAKNSAKTRGIEFELTKEEYYEISTKNCYYCDQEPVIIKRKNYPGLVQTNGVDRVDNNIGYIKDNCVPCCKICNVSKNNIPVDAWYDWISRVSKNLISKNFMNPLDK